MVPMLRSRPEVSLSERIAGLVRRVRGAILVSQSRGRASTPQEEEIAGNRQSLTEPLGCFYPRPKRRPAPIDRSRDPMLKPLPQYHGDFVTSGRRSVLACRSELGPVDQAWNSNRAPCFA